jgi:hypothetical protein
LSAVSAGISIREFARREGCNDKLVRRAINSGHLSVLADGTLDPALIGSGWRKTNRRADICADKPADTVESPQPVRTKVSAPPLPVAADDETPDEAAERIISTIGAELSLAEAERLKENYLALLRQLEYDIKSGQVVLVAEVVKAVAAEYAKVRTRLLAIPAEQAPRLHQCQTVAEVQDLLQAVVAEALEELTRDGASAAG